MSQLTLIIFGPTLPSIPSPFGNIRAGDHSFSVYSLTLIFAGLFVPIAVYAVMNFTRFGLHARATMQDAGVAGAMGINSRRVYATTFAIGSGLAGLAGALYAPTMSVVPTMGGGFVVQAFVTVVTGGGSLFYGTLPAAAGLGMVQTVLMALFGNLVGVLGLLAAVILSARFFPMGLAYYLSRSGKP